MLGWTPTTYDAHNAFFNLAGHAATARAGVFNNGGYSNPKFDALIDRMLVETDPAKRQAMISRRRKIAARRCGLRPAAPAAGRLGRAQEVELQQLADNSFPLRYVRVE